MTLKSLQKQIKTWHQQQLKVVLVTGVFDLLHIEHLRFLEKAKQAGDKLIVGIETDARVTQIKGPDRPVNTQTIRLEQLNALKIVDAAFVLPKDFNSQVAWEQLIAALKPDVYAVSSHTSYLKNKRLICRRFNVALKIVHRHNPDISTSLLIAKLLSPHIADNHPRYAVGIVSGFGRGKTLGYPTLNLTIPMEFPYQHGIYAGYAWINDHKYLGAFHYGPIPVFNQTDPSLEVFLINFPHPQVTASQVKFQFRHYLRPIKHFDSTPELTTQIAKDVLLVKTLLKT